MRLTTLGATLLFAGLVQTSFASTITNGSFNISGNVFFTVPEAVPVVTAAGTCPAGEACIFWEDTGGTNADKVDISASGLPNGDIPSAIAGADAANIGSLTNPPDVVGGFAPATFMTFNSAGITTQLLINFIEPGIDGSADCAAAPAPGQICTPTGSPVNFTNTALDQSTGTWVFSGVTNTPGVSWTGDFTSQFTTPYQTFLADLVANESASNSFAATITLKEAATTVPEPGSMGLTMISLGLIGTFLRRRSAK
jgi:hypothetical protein